MNDARFQYDPERLKGTAHGQRVPCRSCGLSSIAPPWSDVTARLLCNACRDQALADLRKSRTHNVAGVERDVAYVPSKELPAGLNGKPLFTVFPWDLVVWERDRAEECHQIGLA
jgi:hypothetical protein